MSRVSIIIATYNFEHYIGEAISSVLNQTFADFDLLVLDDASPDNTREVVEKFQDPRLRFECNERNLGHAVSKNKGLRSATGQYVAFLDGDDVWEPEFLEQAVKMLDSHPELSVVHGAAVWVDEQGDPFGETNDHWKRITPGSEAILDCFRFGFCFSTIIVRTPIAKKVGLKEEWRELCDAWYMIKLALEGDMGYLHKPLVRYRVHQKSMSVGMYQTGEFFERHLQIVKEVFSWPEVRSLGVHRLGKQALTSVAREHLRLLHTTRLAGSRWTYLRCFGKITRRAPSVFLFPETWLRLLFGLSPTFVILQLRRWKRTRWTRLAAKVKTKSRHTAAGLFS